jgi:exopolysaccharide production protein ExoQ
MISAAVLNLRRSASVPIIARLEYAVLFLTLMLIFGAFTVPFSMIGGSTSRTAGNAIFQLVSFPLYGFGLMMLVLNPRNLQHHFQKNWLLWIILAYIAASALWSSYPETTLRRAFALFLTTIFASYVSERFESTEFLRVLAAAIAVYLVITVCSVAVPGLGIAVGKHLGALQGVSGHKNALGRVLGACVLMCAAIVTAAQGKDRRRGVWLMLACGFLLIFTQSLTSWLAGAAGAAAAFATAWMQFPRLSSRLRLSKGIAVLLVVLGVVVVTLAFVAVSSQIFLGLGRGENFSGRERIWRFAIEMGQHRPWLGYGYRAFWTDAHTLPLLDRMNFEGARTAETLYDNGHSSYIDTWVELGWTGIAILGVITLVAIKRAVTAFSTNQRLLANIMFGLLVFMAIYSFSEKMLLEHTDLPWFLFTLFFFYAGNVPNSSAPRARSSLNVSKASGEPTVGI